MLTFQRYRQKVVQENSAPSLFAERLVLPFRSARIVCPECRQPLNVYKTYDRTLKTLHLGCFTAHETLLHCGRCQNSTIYSAKDLGRLAPSGGTFGYDVLIAVGKGLFLRDQRAEEIVNELSAHQVDLSPSEVGYLGKKFVVYLALAHRQSAPQLRAAMREEGGYILHLDGTCEGGGPMLMSSLDSISEIVLGSVKVPTEKAEQIIPFLKEIKSRYGVPIAAVHDMGTGILAAIQEVFPRIPDFICHFHFLRDIGKDLLESDYDAIRQQLRRHGLIGKLRYQARRLKEALDQEPDWVEGFCQSVYGGSLPTAQLERFPLRCAYSLIQWALEGKAQGEGYGFPFDRPEVELATRLKVLGQRLEDIKDIHLRGQGSDNKPLLKVFCLLGKLTADEGLERMLAAFKDKAQVFDRLRSAMRIAETGGGAGLNSGSDPMAMGPIQKAVEKFRKEIGVRSDNDSTGSYQGMIDQIDKYSDKLFADPITVKTPHGPLVIQPQRTNNLMERFFRDFRRSARRRTGHNSISRFLQSMIADTPLVRNLQNPSYLKILLRGRATLEERFAQIDIETVREELQSAQASVEKVPSKIRRLIAVTTFPEIISRLFHKAA